MGWGLRKLMTGGPVVGVEVGASGQNTRLLPPNSKFKSYLTLQMF